jgi:hypothetical protein
VVCFLLFCGKIPVANRGGSYRYLAGIVIEIPADRPETTVSPQITLSI